MRLIHAENEIPNKAHCLVVKLIGMHHLTRAPFWSGLGSRQQGVDKQSPIEKFACTNYKRSQQKHDVSDERVTLRELIHCKLKLILISFWFFISTILFFLKKVGRKVDGSSYWWNNFNTLLFFKKESFIESELKGLRMLHCLNGLKVFEVGIMICGLGLFRGLPFSNGSDANFNSFLFVTFN